MSVCPPYAPFFGFAGVTAAVSIPSPYLTLRFYVKKVLIWSVMFRWYLAVRWVNHQRDEAYIPDSVISSLF